MSPYLGIIKMNVQQVDGEYKTLPLTWRVPLVVTFAFQDSKWILKTAIIESYSPFNGDSALENADVMQPQGNQAFKIIRDRLRMASEQAGGG